jgi:hypothetical protein
MLDTSFWRAGTIIDWGIVVGNQVWSPTGNTNAFCDMIEPELGPVRGIDYKTTQPLSIFRKVINPTQVAKRAL